MSREVISYLKQKIKNIEAQLEAKDNFNELDEDTRYYLLVRLDTFKEMLESIKEV